MPRADASLLLGLAKPGCAIWGTQGGLSPVGIVATAAAEPTEFINARHRNERHPLRQKRALNAASPANVRTFCNAPPVARLLSTRVKEVHNRQIPSDSTAINVVRANSGLRRSACERPIGPQRPRPLLMSSVRLRWSTALQAELDGDRRSAGSGVASESENCMADLAAVNLTVHGMRICCRWPPFTR